MKESGSWNITMTAKKPTKKPKKHSNYESYVNSEQDLVINTERSKPACLLDEICDNEGNSKTTFKVPTSLINFPIQIILLYKVVKT